MRHITVGGLSDSAFAAEDVRFPVVDEVDALTWVADALDQAVTERKGVAVIAPKGCGKTVAAAQAVDDFNSIEREAQRLDDRHVPKAILDCTAPRSGRRREVLEYIWKKLVGMPPVQPRGRRVPNDQLLEMLVQELERQRIAVIVMDEAERLSDTGLEVLRDIVSEAEAVSADRYTEDGYRAAGVGVLLLGTKKLKFRLAKSEEAGHRWVRAVEVEGLDPDVAAGVYRKFMPGFEEHIDEIGQDAWAEYVRTHVTADDTTPVRRIENHLRGYIRRMMADSPELSNVGEVPFDQEVFEEALTELLHRRDDA